LIVTTPVRTRWWSAAAAIALAGTALAVSAEPAAAAPPTVRIDSVSSDTVRSGDSVRVRFSATNNQRGIARVFVAVSGGLRCTDGCAAVRELGPGRSAAFQATVVAPQVREGEETGLNLAVSVRVGTQTAFDHRTILVRGGDKPPSTVSQVSGRVRDAAGKAVGGAALTVRDSAGHTYRTSSGKGGKFSVTSSDSRPISPGAITITATRDGYRSARATVQGTAGKAATVRLVLAAVPVRTTTPPSPSAVASLPAVADETTTPETLAESAAPNPAATADDGGSGTLLLTLLGGLLIAGGLGALVLLVIRRRNRPDEPALLPAPTQVMAPVGTMGAGMADAPTAVLRPVPPDGGYDHGTPGGYGGSFR
jgi:Carboxypeptidase regulatory-like domain